MPPIDSKNLQKKLLKWFGASCRALPWRANPTLYGTWISEIMLQQTTVKVVVPFWEKFMTRFPDVISLAAAEESEVLALWSGLGYYRRARHLHQAAKIIVKDYQGILPGNRRQWGELPGVGTYASGAIASIGLGEVVTAVDANARRVLSRWFFDDPLIAGRIQPSELEAMACSVVSTRCPGNWNEAIMELGATLCKAEVVQCGDCPVIDHCSAGLAGTALEIPPRKRKGPVIPIALATVIVRRGSQILLLPPGSPQLVNLAGSWELGRKDISGLFQGLWTIPASPWYLGSDATFKALEDPAFIMSWVGEFFQKKLPSEECISSRMASFGHSITKYQIKVRAWEICIPDHLAPVENANDRRWISLSLLDEQPISNLVSKALSVFGLRNV